MSTLTSNPPADKHAKDRRQARRVPANIDITVHDLNHGVSLTTSSWNISRDGVSFFSSIRLEVNRRYRLRMVLSASVQVSLIVDILWIKPISATSFQHGGALLCSDRRESRLISSLIENFSSAFRQNSDRRKNERRAISPGQTRSEKRAFDRRLEKRAEALRSISVAARPRKKIELNRVVITGIGIVAPNGIGKDRFLNSLLKSEDGISKIKEFETAGFPVFFGGQVDIDEAWRLSEKKSSNLTSKEQSRVRHRLVSRNDKITQFAFLSALQALSDSAIDLRNVNRGSVGLAVGTILGGLEIALKAHEALRISGVSRVNPYTVAAGTPNSASGELTAAFRLNGPSVTFSQGCTSGLTAVTYALNQIQSGKAEVMLAGGADSPFHPTIFSAFCQSKMLAPCFKGELAEHTPFDSKRQGTVLGEGSAMLVLENLDHALARNASIYAEIVFDASTCDGSSMVTSRWHGNEAARAIQQAIEGAGLAKENISAIFAHGTGSRDGDEIELCAIEKALGKESRNIPLTNVKALIGYSQAACGPIEMVAACLGIQNSFIPGLPKFNASAEYEMNISESVRRINLKSVLVNCFGFGGKNVCLVMEKYEH